MKAKDDLTALNAKKDKLIVDLHARAAEVRELADGKVFEIRSAMLENQKDLSGQQELNNLLKKQIVQLENERNKLGDTVQNKDFMVDKVKEEIILLNRVIANHGNKNSPSAGREYEVKSDHEFKRLLSLTDQLKDAQVDAERAKMESLAKDREYLKVKDQLASALEAKNQALRQTDFVKYENQKLKEEQQKFGEELGEVRKIYEDQIDSLASKLYLSAEETLKQKAKASELLSANHLLKNKTDTFKKRLADKDLELEKIVSDRLFEVAGMQTKPKIGSASLMARGELGESQFENSQNYRDDLGKPLLRIKTEKTEPREERSRDMLGEEKSRLDWESLMYRVNIIGTKN